MAVAAITKPLDRWDLIADRELGVPELGWAIAEANPELIGYLVLPAGITLIVPDLATLRRPLTAANPAREDDGEFLPLVADDTPAPIPTGGGVVGDFVPLSAIGVTVAPLFNNLVPSGNLPAPPTLASLGGMSAETIDTALALKVDLSTYNTAIALKADGSAVSTALGLKADISAVNTALALKLDAATFSTAIALKLDISTFNSAIALKADASALTSGLAGKVDTATYNAGLGLKLDAAARNAAGGVAGLDTNSLISAAQIPSSIQFQLLVRSGTTVAVDLNSVTANQAGVKWLDGGGVTHSNLPGGLVGGTLLQYDGLFGVNSGTVKVQEFIGVNGRIFDRVQFTTWLSWYERTYLNKAQSFTALQDFTASGTFKGGNIPAITVSLTQAGVDASGQPILWMVNASATTGNRLKSITVASNGNIRLTHYADDGTAGNVLEHTASGNILTNGTVRPGSGSTAFTGAQFVPGSTYYRTDITEQYPNGSVGNTLITTPGTLTTSNGERWMRALDGTDPAKASKIILTGQLPASIAANTYTNFGTFNGVGKDFIEEVYAVCVYLHFSDSSNLAVGYWQIIGSTVASFVLWKAGGTQTPVTMRMEGHNEADFICSMRLGVTNSNRVVQLAFDKALTFSVVANSYYRITFKRLI